MWLTPILTGLCLYNFPLLLGHPFCKWPYNRGGLSWGGQFSSILLSQSFEIWPDEMGGLFVGGALQGGTTVSGSAAQNLKKVHQMLVVSTYSISTSVSQSMIPRVITSIVYPPYDCCMLCKSHLISGGVILIF
jgi:hypothetical protein